MQIHVKEALLFYATALVFVGAWALYIDGCVSATREDHVEQWHWIPGLLTTLGFFSLSVTPAGVLFSQVSSSLFARGSTEHVRMWILCALTCNASAIVIVLQTLEYSLFRREDESLSMYNIARVLQPFLIVVSSLLCLWRKSIVLQINEEF